VIRRHLAGERVFWGLALLCLGVAGFVASVRMDHQRSALALTSECLTTDVDWRNGGLAPLERPWVRFDAVAPRCLGAVAIISYRSSGVVVHQSVVRLEPGVVDDTGPVATTDVTWGILSES